MCVIASQTTSLTIIYSFIQAQIKKASKLRVTGLCAGKSPGTGEFHAQRASYAENVFIWWRHHVLRDDREGYADITHLKKRVHQYYCMDRQNCSLK